MRTAPKSTATIHYLGYQGRVACGQIEDRLFLSLTCLRKRVTCKRCMRLRDRLEAQGWTAGDESAEFTVKCDVTEELPAAEGSARS